MNRTTRLLLALLLLPAAVELTGCAAAAGAGIATGAVATNDRRTTGTLIDDEIIEIKVFDELRKDADLWEQVHVNATSFNNVVLLTGEAPSEALRTRIGELTAAIQKVRTVHNEIAIAAPSSILARSSDSWITSKVKTRLIGEMKLDGTRVKVVTEKGVVYLMGLVSAAEAEQATELTRRVGGVERVVRLFEIIPA